MLIVLAFANQQDSHLPLLKAESSDIRAALQPLERRGFVKVEHEESTTVKELADLMMDNPDQLTIFHFGGHAGADELHLEDAEASEKGLAQLLGLQKNLKLVFLNGCSPRGQVDVLFEAGVKAVIATAAPINDDRAKDFAVAFYKALAYKQTIKQAFHTAKGVLELRKDAPQIELSFRKLGRISPQPTPSVSEAQKPLWGLYIQTEHEEEVLNFRLPYQRALTLSQDVLTQIRANSHLTSVLEEMCRYKPDLYNQMIEVKNGEDVKRDSSRFMKIVMENLPLPIGLQLRLVKEHEPMDVKRLKNLLSTYIITAQTLYYILLSNLWEEVSRKKGAVASDFLEKIKLTPENERNFDFMESLLGVHKLMKTNDLSFFAPELDTFCQNLAEPSQDLHNAHNYLKSLCEPFRKKGNDMNQMTAADVRANCENAELALRDVLWDAAFLTGYDFFSVRDIELRFPRSSALTYELEWGIADTNTSLFNDAASRQRPIYTNCDSVVMIAYGRDGDLSNYLNLSPFIIDKNTFVKTVIDVNTVQRNRQINLFMYRYEMDGVFHYTTIAHDFFTSILNEKGTDIVHTHMTMRDFEEGNNARATPSRLDGTSSVSGAVPAGSGGYASSKGSKIIKDAGEIQPIFADLELQFLNFKNTFTPRDVARL